MIKSSLTASEVVDLFQRMADDITAEYPSEHYGTSMTLRQAKEELKSKSNSPGE